MNEESYVFVKFERGCERQLVALLEELEGVESIEEDEEGVNIQMRDRQAMCLLFPQRVTNEDLDYTLQPQTPLKRLLGLSHSIYLPNSTKRDYMIIEGRGSIEAREVLDTLPGLSVPPAKVLGIGEFAR